MIYFEKQTFFKVVSMGMEIQDHAVFRDREDYTRNHFLPT